MEGKTNITRRRFLEAGATAAAAVAVDAASHRRIAHANDRLSVGIIGCGSIARNHLAALTTMLEDENIRIAAVCDIYRTRALEFQDRIKATGGDAVMIDDYGDMLAMADIDYVIVATPEHTHHSIVMDALNAGKHVYCEKPLCYSVRQAKEVVAKAKQTGLVLQVGVQGMADDSYSSAYEAIREGLLGPVVEAQTEYVLHHSLSKGPFRNGTDPSMAQPSDLDWNRWVYPLRKRPWNPQHYHEWRCYSDYSSGIASDLLIHRVTRLIRACGLSYPSRAVGMGGIYLWDDGRDTPDSLELLLEYPAVEGVTPGMTVHALGTMANAYRNRHCIRGHNATLLFTNEGWEIIEERSKKTLRTHVKTGGEDTIPHHKNHHAAIRHGAELFCPPELGLYGVVAARMGYRSWKEQKMLSWDSERARITRA